MYRDSVYLTDILNACANMASLVEGMTYESFTEDYRTQLAVLHLFTIIGEASRRLSPLVRAMDTEDALKQAIAMRSFVVHQYDDVEFGVVWETATDEIPRLRTLITEWLAEAADQSPS
jgi:uncharacterized protein with HEPN domain